MSKKPKDSPSRRNKFRMLVTGSSVFVVLLVVAGVLWQRASSDPITPRSAAMLGGEYLVRHFHSGEGHYDYVYNPVTDRVSSSYNLLRHAGTTYALLSLYENTHHEPFRTTAEEALTLLAAQEGACPMPYTKLRCLYEKDSVKLGANALGVLAFSEHVRVTGDTNYLKMAQRYAAWIVVTQADSGEFTQHKQTEDGATDDLVSEYYPGEAIFGLMRLYALDHDVQWLNAARKAALWLIEVRDAGKGTDTLAHDHWLLYGLNELHAQEGDMRYVEHARRITDSIARIQHLTATDTRWVGGFYTPPRSTPTATRVEGLVAAYALFTRAHDEVYGAHTKEIMDRAVPFLLRTHVTKERAVQAKLNVEGALGGFTESLDEYSIRIDYVQHNISALLGYAALSE